MIAGEMNVDDDMVCMARYELDEVDDNGMLGND
jgi:hypothetical protein